MVARITRRRCWGAGLVLTLMLSLVPTVSWADLQRVTLGVGGMMCPI